MKKKFYLVIFLFLVFFLSNGNVHAADVSLLADKNQVTENQTFSVSIYTNTKGVSINNIESIVSFPKDLLSVESVNNNSSIFSIWVEQPIFSNIAGTISFNGGVPTPGYNGTQGKVLNILFRAKKAGIASILFSSASIYANDGLGTNITSLKNGTSINIDPYKGAETPEEVIVSDKLPPSPIIFSREMPDSEVWYSLNRATFTWELPAKVIAVQVLFDNRATSIPNTTFSPPIGKKEINDLTDGTRYLHVRFKNSAGWGKTTHRKIKIDTSVPTDLEVFPSTTKDDLISLKITSRDLYSGIGKYKISVDGVVALETVVKDRETNVILPPEKSGNHDINVIAYDRAENLAEKVLTVEFPKMKAPEITKYSETIVKREKISITGLSYANTDIKVWLQLEGENPKSYIVKSLMDGTFSFESDPIEKTGLASFWTEAVRAKEIISPSSEKYFTLVNKTIFVRNSLITMEILSVSIPLLLLIILLIYLVYHAFHKLKKMRRKLLLDLSETETEAHKVFRIIKEDVKKALKILEQKESREKLSEEEVKALESLSKDVKEAEDYFSKRIKDIEKKDL